MGELPSGMVTFLFTDLVGSTRMWDEQPDAMRVALQRHDVMLRRTIEAHGGRVVKTTGDGVYAAFADAHDAVTAAASLARAFASERWEVEAALQMRTGLHTGSAEARDGDYFGPTLNRASRLMSAAHGGQVVLSAATADLVRSRLGDDVSLRDLGAHRLRGISQPEHVFQLDVRGLPTRFPPLQTVDAFPGRLALPAPVIVRSDEELAGRASELDSFERAWKVVDAGARAIVLVAGEPGIGKTRIAAEYATRAYERGAVVLYGRCDEEAIVPYQPFVEALRPCVDAYTASALHERLHGLERDLARVFPELLGRIPELSLSLPSDPEAERYRLFEAITTLLTGIAVSQPTMLVLDDLQWADKPTLLLLRHIVRSAPRAALMIVGCYRDVELERGHQLADLLADIRREPSVTNVRLGGLSESESGQLVRQLAGADVAPAVIAVLHGETNGNPFFLEELIRHLVDAQPDFGALEGGLGALDLPESVREAVARRLRRLPADVNDVLDLAAVVGRQFDAVLLGRAAGQPVDAVLGALDRAVEAGVVKTDPDVVGRYVFAHALIRQTVNASLGTARRAQLHAAAGRAMERPNGERHRAAEIALHFSEALPLVGAATVIDYTARAGRDALADFAFEAAAAHFDHALRLLEQHAPGDTGRRIDLLIDLANALLYVDERAGVHAALDAVRLARDGGAPVQFGRAVLVVAESTYGPLTYPDEVAKLFDDARALLGEREPTLRARLLAFEAFKYAGSLLRGRQGRPIAEEAVALARSTDDAETLTDALFTLAVTLEGSLDVARRIETGEELMTLGRRGSRRAPAFGLRVLARAHLEMGDATQLACAVDDLVRIGEQLRWLPAQSYATQWRATLATIEGRFDEARACGEELRRFARAYRGAAGMHTMQAFYLARERGDVEREVRSFAELPDAHAHHLYTAALVALTHLEAGNVAGSQRMLDLVTSRDLLGHDDSSRGAVLGVFAEVAATTGPEAAAHAEALLEHLTPFSGRLLCVVLGLGCMGAADRYLGMLHTVLGHHDAAEASFEQALALEDRVGARAFLPRTRYWQARWHLVRDRAGDRDAARALLARVASETQALGMARLHAQAVDLAR